MPFKTEVIDATPLNPSGIILPASSYVSGNRQSKPLLSDALDLYKKHYLTEYDGIPGEGEKISDILARLQGDDPNVKRMTLVGLKDNDGKLQGIAFIETYEVTPRNTLIEDAKPGLVHLCTYAAMTPPCEHNYEATSALHAGVMAELKNIDRDLGFKGNSVYVGEVNSVKGFAREKLSDAMDPEFEIKTGAPRKERAIYDLEHRADRARMLTMKGRDGSNMHVMDFGKGAMYATPNLDAEGATPERLQQLLKDPKAMAANLQNNDIKNGLGEPLYIVTKSTYYEEQLNARDIALSQAFMEQLYISVAHLNMGIKDPEVVRQGIRHIDDYQAMDNGFNHMILDARGKAASGKPPSIVIPSESDVAELNRKPRASGKQ